MTRKTIAPGDGDPRHGTTNGYTNLACRCQDCRNAWAVYCYRRQQVRADALSRSALLVIHGTANGYGNYGCRCEPCTKAFSAATLARYHRRRARMVMA
jgi:hypothetical protein